MNNLIKHYEGKYFVNLGRHLFSPISKTMIGLSLDYCDLILNGKDSPNPMFFCFPEKNSASLWLSIALLTNYYYEDHINNIIDEIEFVRGEKVEIFGCIAKVKRCGKDHLGKDFVEIDFKDQPYQIYPWLRPQLSKVEPSRMLNNFRRFAHSMQKAKLERNPISKILEPKDAVIINLNNLESKVLLISGRGNTNALRTLLNSIKVYEESLSNIFSEKKNLILKPDLESFKDLFSSDTENKIKEFIKWLKKLGEELDVAEIKIEFDKIIDLLLNDNTISAEFDHKFLAFCDEFQETIPKLVFLRKIYPGIQDKLPSKLRAVIINDINQAKNYPDTIDGFLKNNIPVLIISSRLEDNISNLDFYDVLIKNNPNYYRINWDKNKIRNLTEIVEADQIYIDQLLWNDCLRFSKQNINIEIYPDEGLDKLIPELRREFKKFPEYETLKQAYYDFLELAMTLVKNSKTKCTNTNYLIELFLEVFNPQKNSIDKNLSQLLLKSLSHIDKFELNSKNISGVENNFADSIIVNGKEINIPNFTYKKNLPTKETNQMVFTGFPYNEPFKNYLNATIFKFFVPNITILAWPNEADLTYNYLYRRLKSGYFTDKIPNEIKFPEELLLKSPMDVENEISKIFTNANIQETNALLNGNHENDLFDLSRSKFCKYTSNGNAPLSNPVECYIILFDDDSFMFMPVNTSKKSKVIIGWQENDNNDFFVEKLEADQIEVGQLFFDIDFFANLQTILRISGHNTDETNELTSKLFLWKTKINELFEIHNNNFEELAAFLMQIRNDNIEILNKANPEIHNLHNWISNDEILAPDLPNIQLILIAAGNNNQDVAFEIYKIRNQIRGSLTSLSSEVRKDIQKKFTNKRFIGGSSFEYEKNNVKISCDIKKIESINTNIVIMEYSKTRKVLC